MKELTVQEMLGVNGGGFIRDRVRDWAIDRVVREVKRDQAEKKSHTGREKVYRDAAERDSGGLH